MNKPLTTLSILFLMTFFYPDAAGQQAAISYKDLNLDGKPDVAHIADGNSGLGIDVYDQDGDMRQTGDWQTSCDFDSDAWVFSKDGGGVIIDFDNKDRLRAYVYDDADNSGNVSYSLNGGRFQVTEGFPRITVEARDRKWFFGLNKPDFNLDLYVDYGRYYRVNISGEDRIIENKTPDGFYDKLISYFDNDNDSNPDLEYGRPASGPEGDTIIVSADGKESVQGYRFWPLLGPVIDILWNGSKIESIGNLINPWMREGNYVFSQTTFLSKDRVTYFNLWSPIAYYDLANDSDLRPELSVILSDDGNGDGGLYGTRHYEKAYYTWDQDNDGSWDYGIASVGNIKYDKSIRISQINKSIKTVSYSDAPYWTLNQNWLITTFVADEDHDETWMNKISVNPVFWDYTNRIYINSSHYLPGRIGNREERGVGIPPTLYFSPIDNKLHLLNALEGVWLISAPKEMKNNLGNIKKEYLYKEDVSTGERIVLRRRRKNPYFNEWVRYKGDEEDSRLIYENGVLAYYSNNEVMMKKININQSLFESMPPRDYGEWVALNERLGMHRKNVNASDFRGLLRQFMGEEVSITSVGGNFRTSKSEFKTYFYCNDCKIETNVNMDYTKPLQKKSYVLEYNGSFILRKIDFNLVNPTIFSDNRLRTKIINRGDSAGPIKLRVSQDNKSTEYLIGKLRAGENVTAVIPVNYSFFGGQVYASLIVDEATSPFNKTKQIPVTITRNAKVASFMRFLQAYGLKFDDDESMYNIIAIIMMGVIFYLVIRTKPPKSRYR